jgi:hypothetical protein
MRFPVQCDSVFILLGAKTGKDDFTCLSFVNVASFSDNYCVALGKLSVFWADRGSWGGWFLWIVAIGDRFRRYF